MPPQAEGILRALLIVCIAGMAVAGVAFLRTRNLKLSEYLAWGLLAVLVPLLGPFVVILARPGTPRPPQQPQKGART